MDIVLALMFSSDDRAARLVAAEAAATKAVSLAPESAIAHMCLGLVQVRTNRASQGVRECERALELNRNLADAHGVIGAGKLLLGQAEEAVRHIQEALRLSPDDTFAYSWCEFAGYAKILLGKDEEAVAWLRRSIVANTNYPSSHIILAAALAGLGRLDEARSEAQAGLTINPTFTIARFRARPLSDHPAMVATRRRILDGLRKAGVPEQ